VFFKESDEVWSSKYGGGESLMWLILEDIIEGDEETVRIFMEF